MSGGEVSRLLQLMQSATSKPERHEIFNRVLALVYADLRRHAHRLFARERAGTLQPTALVHEAYARLAGYRMAFQDRDHFMCVAATAMRRCLIEHARQRHAQKRGDGLPSIPLEDVYAALDRGGAMVVRQDPALLLAIDRAVATLLPEQIRFVELRFYLGFTIEEIAENRELRVDTAKKRWRVIKALLARQLEDWQRA